MQSVERFINRFVGSSPIPVYISLQEFVKKMSKVRSKSRLHLFLGDYLSAINSALLDDSIAVFKAIMPTFSVPQNKAYVVKFD